MSSQGALTEPESCMLIGTLVSQVHRRLQIPEGKLEFTSSCALVPTMWCLLMSAFPECTTGVSWQLLRRQTEDEQLHLWLLLLALMFTCVCVRRGSSRTVLTLCVCVCVLLHMCMWFPDAPRKAWGLASTQCLVEYSFYFIFSGTKCSIYIVSK